MYFIKKIAKGDKEDIEQMKKDYYTNLTAPMDDMWEEGIVPNGDFFIIKQNNAPAGYFVLDGEGVMIAFYVKEGIDTAKAFKFVVGEKEVSKAYVSTYDPLFYNQCINLKKEISDNSFLYRLTSRVEIKAAFNNIIIENAKIDSIKDILNYFDKGVGMTGKWLEYYFTKIITNNSLRLFKLGGEIIGTGEIRPSISSEGYAHIGMTVSKGFRKKGLGTYIVSIISKECGKKGYKAISSTTIDNIGSQRALEKNGYECYHKIHTISF